jgi:hypothetical protein
MKNKQNKEEEALLLKSNYLRTTLNKTLKETQINYRENESRSQFKIIIY